MKLTTTEIQRIKRYLDNGWQYGYIDVPDEDALLIIQYAHGCDRDEAEEILAIERGESDGCLEVVHA